MAKFIGTPEHGNRVRIANFKRIAKIYRNKIGNVQHWAHDQLYVIRTYDADYGTNGLYKDLLLDADRAEFAREYSPTEFEDLKAEYPTLSI